MSNADILELIRHYLMRKYGDDVKFTIEMTTKINRKVDYTTPNRYTMLVTKDNKAFMKSDELPGYNKSVWQMKEWGWLIGSLKRVNQEENV